MHGNIPDKLIPKQMLLHAERPLGISLRILPCNSSIQACIKSVPLNVVQSRSCMRSYAQFIATRLYIHFMCAYVYLHLHLFVIPLIYWNAHFKYIKKALQYLLEVQRYDSKQYHALKALSHGAIFLHGNLQRNSTGDECLIC